MATGEKLIHVKQTFYKSAKARPSFGLPSLRTSEASSDNFASERHTISVPREKKRPTELDMDKIVESNHALEEVITKINTVLSPSEGPESVGSCMKAMALPNSTSSQDDFDLSKRNFSLDAISQAVDLNADEDFDVLCVNCYKFLNCSGTDTHSESCFKTLALSRSKEFEIRLAQLKSLINARMETFGGKQASFYEELIQTVEAIQLPTDHSMKERVELLAHKSNSLAGLLLTKRLLCLIKEFEAKSLPTYLTVDDLKAYHDTQSSVQNKKLSDWKTGQDRILEIPGIQEVTSDCENEHDRSDLSGFTNLTLPYFDENQATERESSRKAFYSRCLKVKAKLPKEHPANCVLISSLYKCSVKESVPFDQWEPYIKANLGVVD